MKSKINTKTKDKNGYPIPKKEKCFRCEENFWFTFVFAQSNYSRKNIWGYWTEKKKDQQTFICSPCLRNVYLKDKKFYRTNVQDLKKRRMISSYISSNSI